jgi:hypothetical protein
MLGRGNKSLRGISRRSSVWLATVSTAIAVATGIFTLQDRIWPTNAGGAEVSRSVYEKFIDDVCDSVNRAERARARSSRHLSKRLKQARTTRAQRNALLNNANEAVDSSQYRMAQFKGHDVPRGLVAKQRDTAAAWTRVVLRSRAYVEQLEEVTNRRQLLAVVKTLPAMRRALVLDVTVRDTGLMQLGGGYCNLDAPITTPTITLRDPRTFLTRSRPSTNMQGEPMNRARPRSRANLPSRWPPRVNRVRAGEEASRRRLPRARRFDSWESEPPPVSPPRFGEG